MRIGKIIWGFSTILLVFFLGTGCNKDTQEGTAPSIILVKEQGFISCDTAINAGDNMSFRILATKGTNNITEFYIEVVSDKATLYFDTGINTPMLDWAGSFNKSFAAIEQWNFVVRGRHGTSAVTSITILLDTTGGFGQVISYPSITMGAQHNQQMPGLYSLQDSTLYSLDQANIDEEIQKKIELLYYYQSADLNVIASPGANIEPEVFNDAIKNWQFRNTTRFMQTSLTPDQFNAIANDSIIIANYNESEGKRKAKQLQPGNIYSFKTYQDKLGVFLVKVVTGTDTGSIEIELKIQQ